MSDAPKKPAAAKPQAKPTAASDAKKKPSTLAGEGAERSSAGEGKPSPKQSAATSKADVDKAHVIATWKYARPLTACRFDPLGRYVFAGAEDYSVERFDLKDGKLTPFLGHESWCRAIGFSPDGKTTFTGGYDGRLLWWQTDAAEPKPLRAVAAHEGWIRALAVSPDGKLVATCGNDRLVKLWNAADGKPVRTLAGHESHVYNVAFHPNGKDLASCDLHAVFKHWSLADGKEQRSFQVEALHKFDETFRGHIGGARSMTFSADGKLLGAGGVTNVTNAFGGILECAVASIDWEAGKLKVLHLTKEKNRGTIWGLAWHPDGYWIGMSGGRNALLVCWKPNEAEEFAKFAMKEVGRDFALHPSGLQAAVAMAENQLSLCSLTPKSA
jgi:WD40 repeat protein